jgi:hypothetical protein
MYAGYQKVQGIWALVWCFSVRLRFRTGKQL